MEGKPRTPEQFAGVYQSYGEVPDRYRLSNYTQKYAGQDTWAQYVDEILFAQSDTKHVRKTVRLVNDSWLPHLDDINRHPALATPAEINDWCRELRESGRTRRTCYEHYYVRIYQFYDHLAWSVDHPHCFNSALLAACEYDATRDIWMHRIDTRPPENTPSND